ncbi:MAG: hypothetical protein LUE98_01570 [Tannerellaceae bacterium]|nr:hypothetical protein [Tannerellaceae bacterium]MCD8176167.1 hypothetical protein [Tannerellaceae bacterium]
MAVSVHLSGTVFTSVDPVVKTVSTATTLIGVNYKWLERNFLATFFTPSGIRI